MFDAAFDRFRLFKHFFSSARRRGILRTLRIAIYEVWYERKFGRKTALVIPVDRLDYGAEAKLHAQPYFPSSFLFLHEEFSGKYFNPRGRVFIDFGCGLGRVLLFTATQPLRRIIGVELSSFLCQEANKNISSYYISKNINMPEWEIVCADVRDFEIPDDASIFYFANPFDRSVFLRVLENIQISIEKKTRLCHIIYANPVHEQILRERGFRKVSGEVRDFVIYQN